MGGGDEEWRPEPISPRGTLGDGAVPCVPRRSSAATRRRARRLAPGAIFLSVLVALGAFIFVVMPLPALAAPTVTSNAPQVCIECPGIGTGCEPNCHSPPTCEPVTEAVGISDVEAVAESTNVTISWEVSPISSPNATLNWGNTSAYEFHEYNISGSGGAYTVFLNYLAPNTTYYYEIWAGPPASTCDINWIGGLYAASFSTGADLMSAISGVVTDQTGAEFSQGGLYVQASCLDMPSGASNVPIYAVTSPSGGYSLVGAPSYYSGALHYVCPSGPFDVQIINQVTQYTSGLTIKDSSQWPGHWNETVAVWAPQVVDFVLPSDYLSPYFPAVLDFSNAAANYSTIGYSTGTSTSYTTSLGYSWSVGSGSGPAFSGTSSTSSTYTEGASGGFEQEGGTLDYIVQRETSGTVEFNALSREWAETQVMLVGPLLNGEPAAQDSSFVQPSDWLSPMSMNQSSDTPAPYFVYNSGASKLMEDVLDSTPGFYYTGGVTASTTASATGGYSVSFGLTTSLPGVGSVTLSVGAQWSQTSSTSYTQELTYKVGMPATGGSPVCIDVIGQGGSGTTSADMFGIYTWSPNSEGKCTTP
jgi:hypothetical protein